MRGSPRVVVASTDPNPVVDGRGVARSATSRDRGRDRAARAGSAGAERRVRAARDERATVRRAEDGIAASTARRQPPTARRGGSPVRPRVQTCIDIRAWADAIVVGAGTAIADDPSLTVREFVRRHRESAAAGRRRLHRTGAGDAAISSTEPRRRSSLRPTVRPEARMAEWADAGADVAVLDRDADGAVSLGCARRRARQARRAGAVDRGRSDARVERGARRRGRPGRGCTSRRCWSVDRARPRCLAGTGFAPIGEALRLGPLTAEAVGDDLKVVADVHRHH